MAERGDLADIPDQGPWEDEDSAEEDAPDEAAPGDAPADEGGVRPRGGGV